MRMVAILGPRAPAVRSLHAVYVRTTAKYAVVFAHQGKARSRTGGKHGTILVVDAPLLRRGTEAAGAPVPEMGGRQASAARGPPPFRPGGDSRLPRTVSRQRRAL